MCNHQHLKVLKSPGLDIFNISISCSRFFPVIPSTRLEMTTVHTQNLSWELLTVDPILCYNCFWHLEAKFASQPRLNIFYSLILRQHIGRLFVLIWGSVGGGGPWSYKMYFFLISFMWKLLFVSSLPHAFCFLLQNELPMYCCRPSSNSSL